MKLHSLHLFSFFFILFFFSCGSIHRDRIYQAAHIDGISRLQKQNDFDISYSQKAPYLERDTSISSRNIQVSYSPIKHLGLSFGQTKIERDSYKSSLHSTNAAIGGYYFFQTKDVIRKNGLRTPTSPIMPEGILIDFYTGVEWGNVKNYYEQVIGQNQFEPIELSSNFQLRRFFVRAGFHYQKKIIGYSVICKFGQFNFEEGDINLEGQLSSRLLTEFIIISNLQSGNYFEPTAKIFLGKENIQGFLGITHLYTYHDLDIGEKDQIIYFGLSADIDNLFRGIRRIRKNKN